MVVIAEALIALDERPRCVPASAWPGSLDGLGSPGLYAWWVDAAGAGELSDGLGEDLPAGRIYVGQAGAASSRAGLPSASTLRSRVTGDHLGGRVRSSTLRRTLASVLLVPLRLDLVGPRRLSAASEARLSDWMQDHLSVAVYAVDSGEHLAELEKCLVAALRPPLNVEHMLPSPMRSRLQELRAIVLHGIDDLWAAPDPELTDWRSILGEYGQAFDGYGYAKLVRHGECAEVADEVWRRFEEEGRFTSSFADLRCALFWLQRCVHSAEQTPGWRPDGDLERRVRLLYGAVLSAWQDVTSDAPLATRAEPGAAAIQPPTQTQLDQAATAFDRDWGGVDEVLYGLCREHPAHSERRAVTAKLVLIDRAYSAGLERQVDPDQGAQAITKIADFMVAHGAAVDALMSELIALQEPLDADAMASIVSLHGRFATLLRELTRGGMTPRSFAAKYPHFHHPVVPIYDGYAADRLIKLVRWDSEQILFERPDEGDLDYWDFCVRFLRLYAACLRVGLDVTVKSLDTWLWRVPKAK